MGWNGEGGTDERRKGREMGWNSEGGEQEEGAQRGTRKEKGRAVRGNTGR